MSLVRMTIEAEGAAAADSKPSGEGFPRWARPALGLLLPLALALAWEWVVRAGYSSGRLVPPPSVIFDTFAELAKAGELQRHAIATCLRVAAGFAIGVVASLLGVAGGELLIPTLILMFGVDIKLAGSLSLAISLPTMLVGFGRYSRDASFAVLARNGRFVAAIGPTAAEVNVSCDKRRFRSQVEQTEVSQSFLLLINTEEQQSALIFEQLFSF